MTAKKYTDRHGENLCDPGQRTRNTYLGTNRKVFDAELYAIGKALGILLKNRRVVRRTSRTQTESRRTRFHIWEDSQAAITGLKHCSP